MWKTIFTFGSQLISLTRKVQQHEEDIKALRQELRAVVEAMQQRFEQQRDRENAAHERGSIADLDCVARLLSSLLDAVRHQCHTGFV